MSDNPDPWSVPEPPILPRPTYAPAVIAFGMSLVAFGLVLSVKISAVGFVLTLLGGASWIGELRHERREYEQHESGAPAVGH